MPMHREQVMLSRPYFCDTCGRERWLPAARCTCGAVLPAPKVVRRGEDAWILWGALERRAMAWRMYTRLMRLRMFHDGWILPYLDKLLKGQDETPIQP